MEVFALSVVAAAMSEILRELVTRIVYLLNAALEHILQQVEKLYAHIL